MKKSHEKMNNNWIVKNEEVIRFLKVFVINLGVFFVICETFVLNQHFATDDYGMILQQKQTAWDVILISYRNSLGAVYLFFQKIGINVVLNQAVLGIVMILVMSFSVTMITQMVLQELKSNLDEQNKKVAHSIVIIIDLGSLLLFANAFLSEWLWFSMAYVQWIGAILGMTLAIFFLQKSEHRFRNWCIATIFLFGAVGFYQMILAQFAFIVMTIIFIRNRGRITKNAILDTVRAAILAPIGVGGQVVLTKMIQKILQKDAIVRVHKDRDWQKLFEEFIKYQGKLWTNGLGLLPNCIMLIMLILMVGVLMSLLFQKKPKWDTILFMLIVIISGTSVVNMIPFVQGSMWIPARVMLPIFGVFSVFSWLIGFWVYQNDCVQKVIINTTIILMIVFLAVNGRVVQKEATVAIKTNVLDQYDIKEIDRAITEHEEINGVVINKVGFCKDKYPLNKYYDIKNSKYSYEMQLKAFGADWSMLPAFEFYTGREVQQVAVPQEIQDKYVNNNWNYRSVSSQLTFEGDTVYVCCY